MSQYSGDNQTPKGNVAAAEGTRQVSVAAAGTQAAIKHDGFRFICRRGRDDLRIYSRRGHDWTDRVPAIARVLALLPVTQQTVLAGHAWKLAVGFEGWAGSQITWQKRSPASEVSAHRPAAVPGQSPSTWQSALQRPMLSVAPMFW